MDWQTSRPVRRTVLPVIAASSIVALHQFGLSWVTSSLVTVATVLVGVALGGGLTDYRAGIPILPGWGNRPHQQAADGIDTVSLKAIIEMAIAAQVKWPASYALSRRALDRPYVYPGVVVYYALLMLRKTVLECGAETDREQYIEQLTDQMLPRWYRLLGRGREDLNYILRRHGAALPAAEETGVRVDTDAAVVALALLLENPILQIRAMRPYLAAYWRADPTLAAELRRPALGHR